MKKIEEHFFVCLLSPFLQDVQAQSMGMVMCEIFHHRINGLEDFGKFPRYSVVLKVMPS